jgi:hypothetical protein
VVWFESAGRRVTEGQLRELVTRGKTRRLASSAAGGAPSVGRLVLDVGAVGGAAKWVAER